MKEADIDLGPHFISYCRVCIDFERNNLDVFDEDGKYAGYDGEILILLILDRFERLEMYRDCAFLRDFLAAYRDKFKLRAEVYKAWKQAQNT